MSKKLTVLSLFDGISCWRIAIERAGFEIDQYLAAEIKDHAIKISKDNYPDIIRLWNVKDISYYKNTKTLTYSTEKITWIGKKKIIEKEIHNIVLENWIDVLIGWSPCQDFSMAWKRLNFDGNKSVLFFEYLRLLKEISPKYFLLENVKMDKDIQNAISFELGVEPININSSLLSCALRNRFYWTNIANVEQPKDLWITLQSVLTSWITDRLKARALLESDSRPLRDKTRMYRRYKQTWFTTIIYENSIEDKENIRYLNQIELEHCQTLPDWYTKILSRDNAAWCIGDGWTVDVITHILKNMEF